MASLASHFRQSQPPTPPKHFDNDQYVDDAIKALDSSPISHNEANPGSQNVLHLDTPPPSSPIDSAAAEQLQRRTKRLRFSSVTRDCGEKVSDAESSIRVSSSAPRTKSQASSKSILKATAYKPLSTAPSSLATSGSTFPPGREFESLAAMLQSVVVALSSPDLHTRRDAYHALTSTLRAYKDFPSTENLTSNLANLEQYIERDISIPPPSAKVPEQALQCAFILIGRLPDAISAKFISTLIDKTIRTLDGCNVSKETAKHQLNLLTLDEMYGRSMTSDRAKRLLKGLSETDKWLTGNSILGVRLIIYKQLARHQPNSLLEDVHVYLPHVFHGLVSKVKELRLRAMETGIAFGTILGERQRFTRATEILLGTKEDDGTPYATRIRNVLSGMLKGGHDVEHVPQVWGVVMVMLRGNQMLVRKWLQNKEWLTVLQSCFNKGDTNLNRFAWTAWNLAIFAAGSLLTDQEDVCKRLVQPVIGHLQRFTTKTEDPIKQSAYSTLNLLWYNAFGQPLEDSKAEACWKHLVHDVCRKVLEKNPQEATRLGSRTSQLLSGPGLKVWRSDRAVDSGKAPISIQELPRIDPQWTRRYCTHIFPTTRLFVISPSRSKHNDEAIRSVWHSLMVSLSQATEKEIKVSLDSKKAIASTLNALHELSRSSELVQALPFRVICDLAMSAVTCLGPDAFVEESMRMTAEGHFEVTSSPMKVGQSTSSKLEAAFVSIFRIIASCQKITLTNGDELNPLIGVLRPLLQLRGGLWSTITTLRDCLRANPASQGTQAHTLTGLTWQAVAELALTTLEGSDTASRKKGTDSLGREYSKLVEIIDVGLLLRDTKCTSLFQELYQRISHCARDDAGDGGYLLAVAAPITRHCLIADEIYTISILGFISAMSAEGIPTPDEKALAHAARSLGEHFIHSTTDGPLEWFENLCQLTCRSLRHSYDEIESLDPAVVHDFLEVVVRLSDDIDRLGNRLGPVSDLFVLEIQDGLAFWAQDRDEKMRSHLAAGSSYMDKVEQLWRRQLRTMSHHRLYEKQLVKFEDCFAKGFCSNHKTIAKSTIEAWSALMDTDARMKPSQHFLVLLTRLQTHVEIQIPVVQQKQAQSRRTTASSDLPINDEDIFPWLCPDESQTSSRDATSKSGLLPSAHAHSRPLVARVLPLQQKTTPNKVAKISSHHKTPPPRLRHNDSQVHFVAVASSPSLPEDQESQMMTDRQKETRERQKRETMLFSDLRSSSPARSAESRLRAFVTKGARTRASLDGTDEVDMQLLEVESDVMNPERPLEPVNGDGANAIVLTSVFGEESIPSNHEDHEEDVDRTTIGEEHPMELSAQQSDEPVNGPSPEKQRNVGDVEPSRDGHAEDTNHIRDQRGPQAVSHTAMDVNTDIAQINHEKDRKGQDDVEEPSHVEKVQSKQSDASRNLNEPVSEADGMDITEDMEPTHDVFHDATSDREEDDEQQTLVGSSQPAVTESKLLEQNDSSAKPLLVVPGPKTRTSMVRDSFISHEPASTDYPASGSSQMPLHEETHTAQNETKCARNALPQSSTAEAGLETSSPEQEGQATLSATADTTAKQAFSATENGEAAVEDHNTLAKLSDMKQESKRSPSKVMQDGLDNGQKDTVSDDTDCIIVREPTDATPPLRDLLKVRGGLNGRTNSPSPSLLTTKRRGRPSLKRKLDSVEDADAPSQASTHDTPTNSRGPRGKRRKSEEQTSQASLSQQSASGIISTSQPKRRQSRKSDQQSHDQQETPNQEQKSDIRTTSQNHREIHDTPAPSQTRRSGRFSNALDEPFEPVELPQVRKRRKTVAVVIDRPPQLEKSDDDAQLTPKSNTATRDATGLATAEMTAVKAADPAQSLILRLRAMLEDAKELQLPQEAEETVSDLAFQLQREIAKAGRRSRA